LPSPPNWLPKELHSRLPHHSREIAGSARRAAAILACSQEPRHTEAAYRIASSAALTCATRIIPGSGSRAVSLGEGKFPGQLPGECAWCSRWIAPPAVPSNKLVRRQATEAHFWRDRRVTDLSGWSWGDLIYTAIRIGVSAPTSAGKAFVYKPFCATRPSQRRVPHVYIVHVSALHFQVPRT